MKSKVNKSIKSKNKCIPKVIHQIWIGDQSKKPIKLINTWKNKNPNWDHILWTEENLPKLICQEQYDLCPSMSGKADIIRYQLLHDYGGFFIDADSECIKSLDDDLLDNEAFCCWENEFVRPGLMSNGYLASIPGNEFLKKIIESIGSRTDMSYHPLDTWRITGPTLLTNVVCRMLYNNMTIYPSHYFIPRHYCGLEYRGRGKVYAKQYWGTTPNSGFTY